MKDFDIGDAMKPENWNEGPYQEGDLLIAGRGCIYPGSRMDGWVYTHDRMYFKPLTPEAEADLQAKGYERVHVTGENGSHLRRSEAVGVSIGEVALGLVFVQGKRDGFSVFAEDDNYKLSMSPESGHATGWWYLADKHGRGVAEIGTGVTPPDNVKAIYAALPTKHKALPPDCLCYVCGEDTGGKCYGCGRVICEEHSAGVGDHQYDCWECSEKYCVDCWEKGRKAREKAGALRGAADAAEEDWRKACRKGASLT